MIINNKSDFPNHKHWAIIEYGSIHIPGDERSRTNLGHGYPESSQPIVTYKTYDNKEDWEKEIRALEKYDNKKYSAFLVTPAIVNTSVQVDISC